MGGHHPHSFFRFSEEGICEITTLYCSLEKCSFATAYKPGLCVMTVEPFLDFSCREQLREWLTANHASESHAWVACNRSKTPRPDSIPYVEIVEECLCFGWIDSTLKKMPDGRLAQRISPRRKGSHWTQLNRERCAKLEHLGLMTEAGREVQAYDSSDCFERSRIARISGVIYSP